MFGAAQFQQCPTLLHVLRRERSLCKRSLCKPFDCTLPFCKLLCNKLLGLRDIHKKRYSIAGLNIFLFANAIIPLFDTGD
ncbi:MAG: hypothetical protein ACI8PP_001026 [Candidatus Pseudothioglobus sp.]|jgi:hypothetical protein